MEWKLKKAIFAAARELWHSLFLSLSLLILGFGQTGACMLWRSKHPPPYHTTVVLCPLSKGTLDIIITVDSV